MFHHILVAIDGSAHSERALAEAADLARVERAELTLFAAIPHVQEIVSFGGVDPLRLSRELEVEYADIVRHAAESVPPEVSVRTILSAEPVREALMAQIATHAFDLLVMGSRGRGALRSTLLGSVSHHVLNHSSIPVLVVHAQVAPPAGEGFERQVAHVV